MNRSKLNDLTIFVEVVRRNGFRAAAKKLKLGPGSVSEAVQRFEDRLGVRLIERTTRAISVTSAGKALYQRSLPAISELNSALEEIGDIGDGVSGVLRLTAPIGTGKLFLDTLISDFAEMHSTLTVEVVYDEKKVDLVTSGIDAAIRAETLLDPETFAAAIGPTHDMVIVASPAYLQNGPVLKSPADIASHQGICFAYGGADNLAPWVFRTQQGPVTVMPSPRIISNDVNSILSHAQRGLGLAYIFSALGKAAVKSGDLTEVLPGHAAALPRFSLNYLSKRNIPARLRAFIDFVKTY